MKGGGGGGGNRRWKGLVVGVLGLVLLSMLVPFLFLLALHNGFHSFSSSYGTGQASASNTIQIYDQHKSSYSDNQPKEEQATHVDKLIEKFRPTINKDFAESLVEDAKNETKSVVTKAKNETKSVVTEPKKETRSVVTEAKNTSISSAKHDDVPKPRPVANKTGIVAVQNIQNESSATDDIEKSCEEKFGSYCLWRVQHKEKMKDDVVKKMKDQLYVARAYYPSIAKLSAQDKLSREMKQNIQDFEKILSETTTDADLPTHMEKKLQKMESVIGRAKSLVKDCNNVDKKLRQLVDLTEDEANFHMKQSAFLYELAVQTMPKSLHCLTMRLTVEHFRSPLPDLELSRAKKFTDPSLHHYVIFSDNVLASSAVINSTVINAKGSEHLIFHVLTNKQNYFAMKQWFLINTFKEALVQVLNVEEFKLEENDNSTPQPLSLPNEIRISFHSVDKLSRTEIRTEYISVFGLSHYLLPRIFPKLKKVVVLDDDVIVQRDLSDLWNLDIRGKVIGAVLSCAVRLGQLRNYLGENAKDGNTCAWITGLNIVDLVQWREQVVTETFLKIEKAKQGSGEGLIEDATVRATLIAFQDRVHALDDTWLLSGLGHDYNLDVETIKKAAVLHFNGNMKPWIEMGIMKYKGYWKKLINRENQFLSDCNVNP